MAEGTTPSSPGRPSYPVPAAWGRWLIRSGRISGFDGAGGGAGHARFGCTHEAARMSKNSPKQTKKPGKARGDDRGPSPERRNTMQSEPALPADHKDPRDGAAVIHPVTDEMMASVAHDAAALADGVAHHTVAPDGSRGMSDVVPTAADPTPAVEAVADVAGQAAEGSVAAASRAPRPALHAGQGAKDATDVARGDPPTPADALSRYNAKVFEVMRTNVASTTALFAALVQARSVPEALSLNAEHLRRQMEAFTSQGRELATLAQSIAADALRPTKGTTDR